MKWLLFAAGLASIFPLALWLRRDPRKLQLIWMAIGALPFVWGALPKRKIVLAGDPEWPGFTQGFDVSALDLVMLAALLALPRSRYAALPFKLSFAFYISAVLLSALQAPEPTASLAFAWQLLRIFMVFTIVARACTNPYLVTSLLKGIAIGLCFQGVVVGWQRFAIHYVQARGTFTSQNQLGMAMHFAIYPFFALLLSGEKGWQTIAVPIIGVMIIIFTTSRASLGFAAAGLSLLFAFSMVRKWTPRMTRMLVAAVVTLALLSPVVYRQFSYRFYSAEVEADDGGRSTLNNAAQMIFTDHPMGIGANNYVVVATTQGYSERANVNYQNRDAYPHNIYWATAAEVGWLGIVALVILLSRPLLLALRYSWRNRKDRRGDLLLGLATSLMIVYAHSYYENDFLRDQIQYLFAINVGLIAGLIQQLRSSRHLAGQNGVRDRRVVEPSTERTTASRGLRSGS